MKKFYIVPHSHLDREWYRTFQENRIKLTHFMDDLLDVMDNDPDYEFYSLDGQTSFMDDYFDVRPEEQERFKRHVQSGRLPIGPWYVQPDEHLPTAEGIIRNLLISKNISDPYDDFMRVGYCPDAFGQASSFPTLMKGFGIESALFYRGFAEDDSKYNDFIWEGIDGSQILATWMPIGYGNAMFLRENADDHNIKEIEDNIELLTKRNISDHYLLMCGSDQSYVKKFLPETVKRLNELYKEKGMDYEFVMATPAHYMEAIKEFKDQMEVVKGELRKGKRSRTHNSIGSTRLDIKRQNFEVEMKYLKVLEPLDALASLYGIKSDHALIERGWKYIVENHAHDSICCCCTDIIHKELIMRMVYADQIAEYLIKEKLQKLHAMLRYGDAKGRPILLFSSVLGKRSSLVNTDVYVKSKKFSIYDASGNTVPYQINEIKPFNLKDTKVSFTPIPDDFYDQVSISFYAKTEAYGYQTYYIKEDEEQEFHMESMQIENGLENEYIQVKVKKDGLWTIKDKVTNQVFEDQHLIIDDGNAGDEYDYSPSFNEKQITSLNCLKSIEKVEDTALKASLKLTYEMSVPESTNNEKRSDKNTDIVIETILTLYREDQKVDIHTTINNTAKNHRLQVLFDLNKKVETNFADIQLGEYVRENTFKQTQESMDDKWHERYYPVFNQHKYSGLRDDKGNGFIVLNKGLPQYEVYNGETSKIGITILSSVGYMGNTDLKYRPGRRSGSTDATPDSQMLMEFEVDYSFMPISNKIDYVQVAENYINPVYAVSYPEYSYEGSLPDKLDIAQSESGIFATTFKVAEKQDGLIMRFLNPYTDAKENLKIQLNRFLFKEISALNLAEEKITDARMFIKKLNNPDGSDIAIMSGSVEMKELNHNQLLTLKLK